MPSGRTYETIHIERSRAYLEKIGREEFNRRHMVRFVRIWPNGPRFGSLG